jgi:hypothetical protein
VVKSPRPVTEFLAGSLASQAAQRRGAETRLAPLWTRAVGAELARHSTAVGFERGKLSIHVDGPVWAHRLRSEQHALMKRMHELLPEPVREIAIRVVPREPVPPRAEVTVMRDLAPRSRELIDAVAGEIEDDALRQALRRLAGHDD